MMTCGAFLFICQREVHTYIQFLLPWSAFFCILCVNAGSQKEELLPILNFENNFFLKMLLQCVL